jgi:GNAT superfamily N-acetyltransferase
MSAQAARIRPALLADAAGIARVHVNTWQTAYKGIINDEILAGLTTIEPREQRWYNQIETLQANCFLYVAELDGEIIGFSYGGPERTDDAIYKGEIYALYLLKEHQRQGIGRMMVEASVISLLANGMSSMLIWVLGENPSRHFYEALGGKYVRKKKVDIQGQILDEVAYGWEDLHSIVKKHA